MNNYHTSERPVPKQAGVGEISLGGEQKRALTLLIKEIESRILNLYCLSDRGYPSAADFFWWESDEELKRITGREELNPKGSVLPKKLKTGYGAILYLAPALRERLAFSTEASRLSGKTQELRDLITLVEETSHFVYIHYCMQTFGNYPEPALAELIAVIDQYLVVKQQRLTLDKNMMLGIIEALFEDNAAAYESEFGSVNAAYIIGHRLGVAYLNYILKLNPWERSVEIRRFYQMEHPAQLRYLFSLGLDVYSYGGYESTELSNLFIRLGITFHHT